MITYEKRTGETIDQKDVEVGRVKLNEILTQEDFDNARKVSKSLSFMFEKYLKFFLSPVLAKFTSTFL